MKKWRRKKKEKKRGKNRKRKEYKRKTPPPPKKKKKKKFKKNNKKIISNSHVICIQQSDLLIVTNNICFSVTRNSCNLLCCWRWPYFSAAEDTAHSSACLGRPRLLLSPPPGWILKTVKKYIHGRLEFRQYSDVCCVCWRRVSNSLKHRRTMSEIIFTIRVEQEQISADGWVD